MGSVLEVKIRTLTPLWTGGVARTMDRIHETGIIGSLRWWYEAIVRGLGGTACDPSEHSCPDSSGRLCDGCVVFGTTGLKRAFQLVEWKFQLEWKAWVNPEIDARLDVKVGSHPKHRGWFLGRGFLGEIGASLTLLRWPQNWHPEQLIHILHLILGFIANWGGLGPKTQQGYGVVEVELKDEQGHPRELNLQTAIEGIRRLQERIDWRGYTRKEREKLRNWPSLENFFFSKARFSLSDPKGWIKDQAYKVSPERELSWYLKTTRPPAGVLPLAPIVRYHLRRLIRESKQNEHSVFSRDERHRLMGEQGRKSLIHVSHAYSISEGKWELRIWGWLPDSLPEEKRVAVVNHLCSWLGIQQEGDWHTPTSGQLWTKIGLSPEEICWFRRRIDENAEDFLRRLLGNRGEGGS